MDLFTRLQDAKLEVDFANSYLIEVQRDLDDGTIGVEDAKYARQWAHHRQRCAVDQYMGVLGEFLHGQAVDYL